jgi:hypothetical protein
MKNLIFCGLVMLFIISCSKDSFQSKPQLFLKSVSSTNIPNGGSLEIKFRLTDKEGDFRDTIWVKKITTRCPNSNFADSSIFRVPSDLPRTNFFDGEVAITLNYFLGLQPRCTKADTAVFSFWMKDAAGNKSDTVSTPSIIIAR